MNGLDMLNTPPSAGATGQAVAARAGDTPPDDPGGDAPRSFNALLATLAEPASVPAEGAQRPAIPGFAAPASTVLRQALQVTVEAPAGGMAEAVVELSAQAADSKPADEKASATSDDPSAADAAGDLQAPSPAPQQDTALPLQGLAPWSAAVSEAVVLMMPALTGGAAIGPAAASLRQPDTPARSGQQTVARNTEFTNGLSTDVGRLLDAAAGATDAVLSDIPATQRSIDFVLNANLTVLRTETHLPPVTPTSPLHQIVTAITAEGLAAASEVPETASASQTAAAPGPERQLVRTLDIRLEPPDLGSVTVKLRLSGEHLALRISADTVSTAQTLEQDRDTLLSLLRGNGYTAEISAVRHEPAAAAPVPAASGTDAAAP